MATRRVKIEARMGVPCRKKLLPGRDHVVDGVFHGLVGKIRATALRRHEASLALVTLECVLVQRILALREPRRPGCFVAELRSAGDARATSSQITPILCSMSRLAEMAGLLDLLLSVLRIGAYRIVF